MATAYNAPQQAITVSQRTGRRIGYVIAILINAVFLVLVNAWPGWEAMPFITADAVDVLPLVNASIAVTMLANALYVVEDAPRVKAVGEVVTGIVALAATSALIDVFPFDFSAYAFPWTLTVTAILWVALIGTGISVVVNLVKAFRGSRRQRATA
ncbi:MAG: hypothetical protein GC156_14610 [Actinomycetales bacterium]|nr:hypothetical protein [Actinomycetales bacterium]